MKSFVKGLIEYQRTMPSSKVQEALEQECGVSICLSAIQDFRRRAAIQRSQPVFQESGAAELLIALALESGFIDTLTDAIYHAVQQQRASEHFEHSRSLPLDHSELRSHGRFTSAYNHCADVNASRFQALEDKGNENITAWVEKLIPHGAECCHFVVEKRKDDGEKNPWHIYSDELGKKAFRKMKTEQE